MEFTIDLALVRKIVAQELNQATAEISVHGPIPALQSSNVRHDTRLADAADVDTLACKAGCSWCCNFSVDVRPAEVLNILDFMQQRLAPAERDRACAEIVANAHGLQMLTDEQRAQHNVKCPFLNAGRCVIYSARPQTCRNYHATDVAGCKKSFDEPDNLDIDPEFAPVVYQTGGAHVDAFSQAMQTQGYEVAAYELNSALALALNDPQHVRAAFAAKLPLFPQLPGIDVPMEFIDA